MALVLEHEPCGPCREAPEVCAACAHNRAVIDRLKDELASWRSVARALWALVFENDDE